MVSPAASQVTVAFLKYAWLAMWHAAAAWYARLQPISLLRRLHDYYLINLSSRSRRQLQHHTSLGDATAHLRSTVQQMRIAHGLCDARERQHTQRRIEHVHID